MHVCLQGQNNQRTDHSDPTMAISK